MNLLHVTFQRYPNSQHSVKEETNVIDRKHSKIEFGPTKRERKADRYNHIAIVPKQRNQHIRNDARVSKTGLAELRSSVVLGRRRSLFASISNMEQTIQLVRGPYHVLD